MTWNKVRITEKNKYFSQFMKIRGSFNRKPERISKKEGYNNNFVTRIKDRTNFIPES